MAKDLQQCNNRSWHDPAPFPPASTNSVPLLLPCCPQCPAQDTLRKITCCLTALPGCPRLPWNTGVLGHLSVIWQNNEVSSEMHFKRLPGLADELPSGHKLILLRQNWAQQQEEGIFLIKTAVKPGLRILSFTPFLDTSLLIACSLWKILSHIDSLENDKLFVIPLQRHPAARGRVAIACTQWCSVVALCLCVPIALRPLGRSDHTETKKKKGFRRWTASVPWIFLPKTWVTPNTKEI